MAQVRLARSLSSTVMAYPKIIYGTAWKESKTTDLVVAAIQQGFRAIDTAGQPKVGLRIAVSHRTLT